jgi:superfamily II DNA helicase RecQ
MQDEFIQQNKLVRPRIVRESTNRPNIKYLITVASKSLLASVTDLICIYWTTKIFDQSRDKIIVYCNTREEARMLGEMLDCPVYTSKSGTWEQKATLIRE